MSCQYYLLKVVEMRSLKDNQRPRSETPDFWNIWTSDSDEAVNWKPIVDEWQKRANT